MLATAWVKKFSKDTSVKITNWNCECVRSTFLRRKDDNSWTLTQDRAPITEYENIPDRFDQAIIVIRVENYYYPTGWMAEIDITEDTPLVPHHGKQSLRIS